MAGRSYPNGYAYGGILKALLKHLEATKGKPVVDGWLAATRTERRDLEDESRAISLTRLHGALKAFVELAGPGSIDQAALHLLAPDNLGAWSRLLRGSTSPVEALDRLDAGDSEMSPTVHWETLSRSPTGWRGCAHLVHDPALETDGLLRAARMAELSMIPALFGLERATVSSVDVTNDRGQAQEFDVRWTVPSASSVVLSGVAVGAALGAVPLVAAPSIAGAAFFLATGGVGCLVGFLAARDRARRTESLAQRMRVYTLERTLLLRDLRQSTQSGTLEGTVVAGQYRIVRRMGSGGSGVIYEAVRSSDGLPVAIKLLRAVAAHEAVASDRLRREAEALSLAMHPNVVDVLDHGHLADGTSYLVMELLRGESLSARLERKTRLEPEELGPIALQVCDALVAVHSAGVVHRDIKPSNIFLTVSGLSVPGAVPPDGDVRVKLIDFGIARIEWEETRITNIGAPIGTPGYMSPEQEAGGDIDARTDIFSFGAVIYECLVGRLASASRGEASDVGHGDPESSSAEVTSGVHAATASLPPGWQAFLARATAPDPAQRFRDARTMAQALRELVAPVPQQAAGSVGNEA